MSHPAKLSLRAPPHLPFVQGWPGIPGTSDRKGSAVHGVVEVRIGPNPIKAKWVRAEIRKYESPPPGFPGQGETWEHVGEISTLWSTPQGKEWDNLEQADFKFYIQLPEHIPPSTEMAKGTGIRYELVAALCYRQKGGMFKKESAPILKISEPIQIVKHDLHSAWPIYNIPDASSILSSNKEITLTVQRPGNAFGPNDRILLTASIRSSRGKPFKLKGFECSLVEIIIIRPQTVDNGSKNKKGKGPQQPTVKTRQLASARQVVDESVGKGGEKSARIEFPVPSEKLSITVRHAKVISVEYELEVKAVFDSGIPELGMKGIKYTVGPFARAHAQQAVRDIGFVEALCPGAAPPNVHLPTLHSRSTSAATTPTTNLTPTQSLFVHTPSPQPPFPPASPNPQPSFPPNGFYANQGPRQPTQPVQGFVSRDMRRKSSGTSTMTTTTTTTFDQTGHHHASNNRPQSMQPIVPSVGFPNANPAPPLIRSKTGRTIESDHTTAPSPRESFDGARYTKSDVGHGEPSVYDNRFSTGTTATFGMWDRDLRKAIAKPDNLALAPHTSPSLSLIPARTPPSAWPSAEQEKSRLYEDARKRAAAAQQKTGASLRDLGLDQPTIAPPEYAPPRPELPKEDYKPPEKPISVFTNSPPLAGPSNGRLAQQQSSEISPPAPSQPPKPKGLDKMYLSAAEEKEQQRIRFEQAQKRVVSGSFTSSQPKSDPVLEDEPIPYDQIFPSGSSSTAAGTLHAPLVATQAQTSSSVQAPVSSANGALSEKEQMRRYYEAQDRVASASGQSSVQGSPNIPQASGLGSNGQTRSAIGHGVPPVVSEKEQMRRYYEAQDRVASASGSSQHHSPRNAVSDTRNDSADSPGLNVAVKGLNIQNGSLSGSNVKPPDAGYLSAEQEKEMMRRRFEDAQAAVERKNRYSSPPAVHSDPTSSASTGQSSQHAYATPLSSNTAQPGPSTSGSGGYLSAEQEKELMRKRFEQAQAAVERNHSSPPPTFDQPLVGSSLSASLSPAPSHSGPNSTQGYLTAQQEKEMMKRRFEQAQNAVNRKNHSSSPDPSSPPLFTPFSSLPVSSASTTSRDHSIPLLNHSSRSGENSSESSAPPPLPSKPPREYIDLLSPVKESGPSFARP